MHYRKVIIFLLLLQAFIQLDGYNYEQSDTERRGICVASLYPQDSGGRSSGESGCGENKKSPCGVSFNRGDPKAKASNIAIKAAQEAKAASDAQMAAAEAAAMQVKTELAEKAAQSARAAEAALAGKQQIVEQLQQEINEADAVVTEVTASLQNTQTNANLATVAAGEAVNQLNAVKRLVEELNSNLGNIENVANGAQQELAEKTQLLEAAKNRVDSLNRQLVDARQDFEKTKQAAYRAACAAVEAKQKASRNRRMSKHWREFRKPMIYARGTRFT